MTFSVRLRDGSTEPVAVDKINRAIIGACDGLPGVSWSAIATAAQISWYDGITTSEIDESVILAARGLIEQHPDYAYAAARLLLRVLYQDVFGPEAARMRTVADNTTDVAHFTGFVQRGITTGRLNARLGLVFDLPHLASVLDADRDRLFKLQGVQILKDRYLLRDDQQHLLEVPQWFWMRVAMGLALSDPEDKTAAAVRYYEVMSTMRYCPSTPTLFNAGTTHPQMASCYTNTVEDSLEGIFKVYTDNARLSKWAGGIGTDWTRVRATGALIKGTNGPSQGLIPWLRIDNDVAVAVNQGSKRKGAHCAYLETWHRDIEAFLELRKDTGDERRRTHDINTANWIPDLFMERVEADGPWTLFSPDDCPELHDLYGDEFQAAYEAREAEYEAGTISGKRLRAKDLWKKMLTMLFETGHPWMTFKDPCNIRNPQQHVGTVHNSNLCSEIVLNNSDTETAVCNIGSVNLAAHVSGGQLDQEALSATVHTAMEMLNAVIDGGFYPTEEAQRASQTHRPVGLGVMGYQDMLYALGIPFASDDHLRLATELFERLAYEAIRASCALAERDGPYASFAGSLWEQGVFPQNTDDIVAQRRGRPALVDPEARNTRCNWGALKARVSHYGLRNSLTMAIAPTATISHILGTSPSIEPTYKNLYVNSSLSGEFVVINEALVRTLEERGLWSAELAHAIKAVDGDLRAIQGLPEDIVQTFPEAFALDQEWLIRAAAVRGRWIDQSQSLNLFIAEPNGKRLHELYRLAWRLGLKTTYYLRTRAASGVNKATVVTPTREQPPACAIDNPGCESCQ